MSGQLDEAEQQLVQQKSTQSCCHKEFLEIKRPDVPSGFGYITLPIVKGGHKCEAVVNNCSRENPKKGSQNGQQNSTSTIGDDSEEGMMSVSKVMDAPFLFQERNALGPLGYFTKYANENGIPIFIRPEGQEFVRRGVSVHHHSKD